MTTRGHLGHGPGAAAVGEDLYPQDKRGRITAKGGAAEWIHWQSGTAQLLPRLVARRTRGPLFLTDRKAPAGTPTLDVCPETGRVRLSYRRAEEIFEENTQLPASPLASPDDIEDLGGWTLHRLRHSALTHDSEDGTSTPMLLARSRHASVRSLEWYARPGVDSVARHVAERDPTARAPHVNPSRSGLQDHPGAPRVSRSRPYDECKRASQAQVRVRKSAISGAISGKWSSRAK
ncbi:hypothetical protein ACFW5I_36480 [Streptomyces sp. NPDC058818]|uniref:hypothetical protein n=1 Tax=Streptomyces sp. NPDC058818 TaxID=3346640 RepID=UPI0036A14288